MRRLLITGRNPLTHKSRSWCVPCGLLGSTGQHHDAAGRT